MGIEWLRILSVNGHEHDFGKAMLQA